jgi:hypothetical protein
MPLIVLSLVINVFVAGLLALALLRRGVLIENTYGTDTPARRILACLYGTTAFVSFAALMSVPLLKTTEFMIDIALVLLPFLIIFNIATRLVMRGPTPVVTANFIIAALHGLTLAVFAANGA